MISVFIYIFKVEVYSKSSGDFMWDFMILSVFYFFLPSNFFGNIADVLKIAYLHL